MAPAPQPPDPPMLARGFPFVDGEGAIAISAALHADAPAVGGHVDFFLGPPASAMLDPNARVARTFRLPLAIWCGGGLAPGIHAAMELEPHRAEYLTLASARELSGGRGTVLPLFRAEGFGRVTGHAIECRWRGGLVRLTRGADAGWHARVERGAEDRIAASPSADEAGRGDH